MAQQHFPANRRNRDGFARSPSVSGSFLRVHDWIPLGRLNDVVAVRSQDTRRRLVTVTLIQSEPWTIGLCFSLLYFRRPYPDWLYDWLVISYGLLFIGQIRAWWIPYLFRPEPKRAARYQIMFGKTHSFLPTRNGMRPKHRAYPASFGDRRHVDRSSHEVRTAISPRFEAPDWSAIRSYEPIFSVDAKLPSHSRRNICLSELGHSEVWAEVVRAEDVGPIRAQ
jgi:hypothetical protein